MIALLRLKHWQLVLFCIGLPFAFTIYDAARNAASSTLYETSALTLLSFTLGVLIIGGWCLALGTQLHSRLPLTVKMSLSFFRASVLIPFVYMVVCTASLSGVDSTSEPAHIDSGTMALFILIHLFSMVCVFYALVFISKALKAVELRRPVGFSDYAGEFFLIWFFPIGIWFIQPRVNRLFSK